MSVRLKFTLYFLGIYTISFLLLLIFSLAALRSYLLEYTYSYMERYVQPVLEFYKNFPVDEKHYVKLLASDIVSREMAVVVADRNNRVIHKEPFLGEEEPQLDEALVQKFLRTKRGVWGDYAYLVKEINGRYRLLLIMDIDRIENIQVRVLRSNLVAFSLLSVIMSVVLMLVLKKLLQPLEYLTYVSKEVSRGGLKVDVESTDRSDEFGLLQRAFREMILRLRESVSWQIQFMRDFAHSLKTPLTYIKGQLELLQKGIYDPVKEEEVLRNMQVQVGRMENLINRLLTLMRLESHVPLQMEDVSLNEIFAELEEEYEFVKSSHNFRVEYMEEDVIIRADRSYLKLALSNLLDNAYKYTPAGGSIRLYFSGDSIVVEDTGRGVEDTRRILEAFYREAKDTEGFGLGLAIVKAVVEKHGFQLIIESTKGMGTKVSIKVFS
ncbi:integral membrane sensor signal transduction histidine kinase [Thermocrinis albus DSM 14484]|uniref:histidine kinase n=1 Tax=Thermocrinis albus (strain DSM 14484 / JCM 11386 / HI 11/12) TaxID=638303 RepID=D3SP69_THEAH|nr:HAMP domain-containing sensor histidine kinase [Thermocrinis albus]ADC88956.1 integral membrane sensor signal transduction histidine kinase [Thermocrinis albus DSM 14484]